LVKDFLIPGPSAVILTEAGNLSDKITPGTADQPAGSMRGPMPGTALRIPQTPTKSGFEGEYGSRRVGEGSCDLFGAAQEGLAGVADNLADGVEQQKAQPFGPGGVKFLG